MDTPLGIGDHFAVKTSLKNLDPEKLTDLGEALGLLYPNLRRMNNILDDMTSAWLNKEDDVLNKSGEPTWSRLVAALEEIGQRGIAEDIVKEHGKTAESESSIKSNTQHQCHIVSVSVAVALFLVVLYFFSPTIRYNFNLYHSKSLPYLSESFVGREQDMKEVLNLVNFRKSTVRIINIIGSPGFGKSTLAIHIGHAVVENGHVVHYVNMADFPDKNVKTVLSEKVLDSARIKAKQINFDTLLKWVREWQYDYLIILDNCDDVLHGQEQEFKDAVKRLVKESRGMKVVITSCKLAPFLTGYEWFRVGELNKEAAHKLLESKVSRIRFLQGEREQIANLTGNVPLALQIIGSLMCLPDSPTPKTVLDQLKEKPMIILTPSDFPANEQILTTINLSYTHLPKKLQRAGHQLTVFPGSFSQDAALSICDGLDHDTLRTLVRSSLLEQNTRTNHYQYHRLIREFFLHTKMKEKFQIGAKLQFAFQTYYTEKLRLATDSFNSQYWLSLDFLDTERHNVQQLLEINKSAPDREILVKVTVLSHCMKLLNLRFSASELCPQVELYLTHFHRMIPELDNYLDDKSRILNYSKKKCFDSVPVNN